MRKKTKDRITISLSMDVIAFIKDVADERGLSTSAVVERILTRTKDFSTKEVKIVPKDNKTENKEIERLIDLMFISD